MKHGSIDRYAFVRQSPVRQWDIYGFFSFWDFISWFDKYGEVTGRPNYEFYLGPALGWNEDTYLGKEQYLERYLSTEISKHKATLISKVNKWIKCNCGKTPFNEPKQGEVEDDMRIFTGFGKYAYDLEKPISISYFGASGSTLKYAWMSYMDLNDTLGLQDHDFPSNPNVVERVAKWIMQSLFPTKNVTWGRWPITDSGTCTQ